MPDRLTKRWSEREQAKEASLGALARVAQLER
jgi:hypothetical protein